MDKKIEIDIVIAPGGSLQGPLTIKDNQGNTLLKLDAGALLKLDSVNGPATERTAFAQANVE